MGRYKIREQQGLNYLTLTVVGWIDIFSRKRYRDIILESLRYCREHKGLHVVGWVYYDESYTLDCIYRNIGIKPRPT